MEILLGVFQKQKQKRKRKKKQKQMKRLSLITQFKIEVLLPLNSFMMEVVII